MKYYVLKTGDYYLEDYNAVEFYNSDIDIFKWYLKDFSISKEVRKLFYDFEKAEEVRKLIFIETGLNLKIELFKIEKDEEN